MGALVASAVIKPRRGRFREGRARHLPAHDIMAVAVGTLMLWFGWCDSGCPRFPYRACLVVFCSKLKLHYRLRYDIIYVIIHCYGSVYYAL
jgi:Ammonium Transporter Family